VFVHDSDWPLNKEVTMVIHEAQTMRSAVAPAIARKMSL
jgi:hypothetical protein